jgi:hypothetical protein
VSVKIKNSSTACWAAICIEIIFRSITVCWSLVLFSTPSGDWLESFFYFQNTFRINSEISLFLARREGKTVFLSSSLCSVGRRKDSSGRVSSPNHLASITGENFYFIFMVARLPLFLFSLFFACAERRVHLTWIFQSILSLKESLRNQVRHA